MLTYYERYGLLPGGGVPILTGPGYVTKDNVDRVIANHRHNPPGRLLRSGVGVLVGRRRTSSTLVLAPLFG